jgi:hypothetical protein
MSQNVTLFGTVYAIPETDERNWGNTMTNFSVNTGNGVDGGLFLTTTGKTLFLEESTTTTFAAGATLTALTPVHKVAGTSGAVTLDGTTAIADGQVDGQMLRLIGTSDTNTVTIDTGANTRMNGQIVITLGDVITYRWDSTASEWQEVGRNN